jgi:hypothetical protein
MGPPEPYPAVGQPEGHWWRQQRLRLYWKWERLRLFWQWQRLRLFW